MKRLNLVVFVSVFLALFFLFIPTLGVRHLSVDEVETAERGLSILHEGVPKVVSPDGRVSVNAAGREIEDGDIHRYTPWVQFYVCAAGLALGDFLGLSPDFSARFPFLILHICSVSLIAAFWAKGGCFWRIVLGLISGLSSVALLHGRTARYHSVLEFLTVLMFITERAGSRLSLLMPPMMLHTHTLGGALCTLIFFGKRWFVSRERELKKWAAPLSSAIVGFISILFLTRPWLQGAWGGLMVPQLRTHADWLVKPWLLIIPLLSLLLQDRSRMRDLLFFALFVNLSVSLLDAHPFSQGRYYIWLSFFVICLIFDSELRFKFQDELRPLFAIILLISLEFLPPMDRSFQSARLVIEELFNPEFRKQQAVVAAFEYIKSEDPNGESPILFDYVPQFVNWYTKNPLAEMPDITTRREISRSNTLFDNKVAPHYHVWFDDFRQNWACAPTCNFHVQESDVLSTNSYTLVVGSEKLSFCILKRIKTHFWNNIPLANLKSSAMNPNFTETSLMFIARRCEFSTSESSSKSSEMLK